jgi:hypothetical protein
MKIRWYFSFLDLLHITPKSSHGSNFKFRVVSMNEVDVFWLMEVLNQNYNTMELINFSKKIQIFDIHIQVVTLKMTTC